MDDAAAVQAARDAQAVQLDESQLTESERRVVNDFAQKIDITDSTQVLQYGAAAQKNIAGFSELQRLAPGLHQRLPARQDIHGQLLIVLGVSLTLENTISPDDAAAVQAARDAQAVQLDG